MTLYVAVDIGCIECGEPSHVLGVFTTAERAQAVANCAHEEQARNWHGQHFFKVFEVPDVDISGSVIPGHWTDDEYVDAEVQWAT